MRLSSLLASLLGEARAPRAAWWPERLAALLALAGVLLASLADYHVREWQDSASDFKTVYASGTLFLRGVRAYNFPAIETVFHHYGVVYPWNWYAHAPTYPPFTYAALAPVLAFPMVPATYLWIGLSALAAVLAIWALAGHAERAFGLTRRWRLPIIVLVAASPVVNFALQLGNVCVMATSLCIIAVACTEVVPANWLAVGLVFSMLLKPHIALALMAGMVLSRNRRDRALAVRAAVFFTAAIAVFALVFGFRPLGLQLAGYASMVRSEMISGCLNPRNHELLPPAVQVPSLESFFGWFLNYPTLPLLTTVVLLVMAVTLVYVTRQAANNQPDTRLELLAAWSTLGLLATYHRSDDAILLFILFPWIFVRLRRRFADPLAWTVGLLLMMITIGEDQPDFGWLARMTFPDVANFLTFRQSALATLALMIVFLVHLLRQGWSGTQPAALVASLTPERDAVPA